MEEKVIYEGNPSHWYACGTYILCFLFCWLIVPIFIGLWKYLTIKTTHIKVTNIAIIKEDGVFSKTINETKLSRITDVQFHQNLLERIVGISKIYFLTTDITDNGRDILPGVHNGKQLWEEIRKAVQDARQDIHEIEQRSIN